jgi:4-hydroxy-2-oxoheptanedioate aldolase
MHFKLVENTCRSQDIFTKAHGTCTASAASEDMMEWRMNVQAKNARRTDSVVLRKLASREPLLSLGIRNARTAEIVRIAKTAGFSIVWIDLEHSSISIDCAVQISAAAADLGLESWVRVPEREYGVIGRLLDGGVTGIVAPRVETADEAQQVVNAARFPPLGQRSQIGHLPQVGYRKLPPADLMAAADRATTIHILLESARGIDNADAIAAIDGVDILHVGMNDLSVDLGHVGDLSHPDMIDACMRVIAAANRHEKLAVTGGASDPVLCMRLLDAGSVPIIFAAIDTDVLCVGLTQRASEWGRRSEEWRKQWLTRSKGSEDVR